MPAETSTAEVPTEPSAEHSARVEAPPDPPARPTYGPYTELWSIKPPGWSHNVAVLASGDVALEQGGTVYVYRRDNGALIESASVCSSSTDGGFGLVMGKLVLACEDAIYSVTVPGLAKRVALPSPFAKPQFFRDADVEGRYIGLTNQAGDVALVSAETWQVIERHSVNPDTFSPKIAVSADGQLVAVSHDTEKKTFVYKKGKLWRTLTNLLKAVRFSPDGSKLFGETKVFEVGELELATDTIRGARAAGSWTNAAVYLNEDWLVVGGSSELRVYPLLASEEPLVIAGGTLRTLEAVGVSQDKRMFCATDRGNTLACFSKDVFDTSVYPVSKSSL